MKKFTRTGRFTTVVAGAVVLAVFGGGTAVAGSLITSAKIKDNTILSKDVHNGTLKSVDVKDGSLNGADVQDGSLNSADIADYSLSNQDIGVLFASVDADGTVVKSSGGVTVSKPATGRYGVRFTGRNIKDCAFTATPATPTGLIPPAGIIGVADELNHPEGAYLFTKNDAGVDTDMGFHITVVC
jgi:hypothetical protein